MPKNKWTPKNFSFIRLWRLCIIENLHSMIIQISLIKHLKMLANAQQGGTEQREDNKRRTYLICRPPFSRQKELMEEILESFIFQIMKNDLFANTFFRSVHLFARQKKINWFPVHEQASPWLSVAKNLKSWCPRNEAKRKLQHIKMKSNHGAGLARHDGACL